MMNVSNTSRIVPKTHPEPVPAHYFIRLAALGSLLEDEIDTRNATEVHWKQIKSIRNSEAEATDPNIGIWRQAQIQMTPARDPKLFLF